MRRLMCVCARSIALLTKNREKSECDATQSYARWMKSATTKSLDLLRKTNDKQIPATLVCSVTAKYFFETIIHTQQMKIVLIFYLPPLMSWKTNRICNASCRVQDTMRQCRSDCQFVPCDRSSESSSVLCIFQNVCERLAANHLCSGRNKLEFMRINTKMPCDKSNSNPLLQIIIYREEYV